MTGILKYHLNVSLDLCQILKILGQVWEQIKLAITAYLLGFIMRFLLTKLYIYIDYMYTR